MKVLTLIKIYLLVRDVGYVVIGILLIKTLIIKNTCAMVVMMSLKAISLHNLCIEYNNGNAYRINFAFMSKNDALNLIKNGVIIDKKGTL